jgi:hypothetical protein
MPFPSRRWRGHPIPIGFVCPRWAPSAMGLGRWSALRLRPPCVLLERWEHELCPPCRRCTRAASSPDATVTPELRAPPDVVAHHLHRAAQRPAAGRAAGRCPTLRTKASRNATPSMACDRERREIERMMVEVVVVGLVGGG